MAKRRGLEAIELRILPDELADFDECFIRGTGAEVTPVAEIGLTSSGGDFAAAEAQGRVRHHSDSATAGAQRYLPSQGKRRPVKI